MGWHSRKRIRVSERAGRGAEQFPVAFDLNTEHQVRAGRMRADGADVRIVQCDQEIPFQMEGMNTACTRVTFQVDIGPGETREDVFLMYGNPDVEAPDYDTEWGSIRATCDGFENEMLRVSYGLKQGTFGHMWGCQNAFVIKQYDEDQFGGTRISDSWAKSRNDVTYWEPNPETGPTFEVEVDGPVYKRVQFSADEKIIQHHPGDQKRRVTDLVQRVTFYRGCPFIKEEFEHIPCGTTTTAVPGGMRLRDSDGTRHFNFVAAHFDSERITWNGIGEDKETRGGWTADRRRAEEDPRYRYLEDYTCCGFLILGVVNLENGRGIGTCANNLQTAFFVDWNHERAGFSLWPRSPGNMTSYLYFVETGHEAVINLGKCLANPPEVTLLDL